MTMRDKGSKIWLLVLGLAICAFSLAAVAQVVTARLDGAVKDPSGLIVPGVTVVATEESTNITYEALSNDRGVFVFTNMPRGSYTLSAELSGFKRFIVRNIRLEVGDTRTVDVKLETGEMTETVTVTAETIKVDTTSTSVGNVVNEVQITNLPLVSRDTMQLFYMQAGANRRNEGFTGGRVDGLRYESNNVQVEGVSSTDPMLTAGASVSLAPVPIEAVGEYRVVTSSASAEYGRGGGAQVQVVYKSGTNEFHGSAFEFHRNKALNANPFFSNRQKIPRPTFIRHQYGGSVGGPIKKDKAFFHFTYEGQRRKTDSLQNALVYTPTLKTGIFRYYTKGANSGSLVDAAGNPKVPAEDIGTINLLTVDPTRLGKDPSGLFDKLVGGFPAPNHYDDGDGFNTGGYRFLSNQIYTEYQYVLKGDYVINPKHRLGASFAYRAFDNPGNFLLNGNRDSTNNEKYPAGILSMNSALTPTFLNEFRVGGTKRDWKYDNPDPNRWVRDGLVVFAGLGGPQRGHPQSIFMPQSGPSATITFADNITWVRGNHSLRGGVDIRFNRNNTAFAGDYYIPVIDTTNASNPATIPALSGLASADRTRAQQHTNDLTGTLARIQQDYYANTTNAFTPFETKTRAWRSREYSFFFQDTWKLRTNLTVQLGLRWEVMPAHYERNGVYAYPVGGAQGLYGISGPLGESFIEIVANKGKDVYNTDRNNFAPNVGFNWDPTGSGKWSVSANYRLAYDRNPIVNTLFMDFSQEGMASSLLLFGQAGQRLTNAKALFNDKTGYFDPGKPLGPKAFNRQGIVNAWDPDYYTPYTQNWSLRIQHEIFRNTVVAVSYVGNHATGLPRAVNFNQIMIRGNGFLNGFLAAQRNLAAGGNPLTGEPTGSFGAVFGVMTAADRSAQTTNITNGAVAAVADFIDRSRASRNYLQAAGLPLNFFRANPQFQDAWLLGNNAYSTWNGMKLEINRRFADGLQFGFNYTFSKGLTDFEGGQTQRDHYRDNEDRKIEKSLASIDATHVLNANFIWELPFGNGRRWMNSLNSVLDGLLGGWQLNGIVAYSTGVPLTMSSGYNKLTVGDASTADCSGCSPGITSKVIKGDLIRALTDDEKKLFTQPAAGSAGLTAQRYFRNSNFALFDGSVFKQFRLGFI
ncbi:MAG: hypothetical protein FJW35_08715, partial [Acidobacteria bacterium]|nr:hypothetical protein [Acidobacteriota bacterium]